MVRILQRSLKHCRHTSRGAKYVDALEREMIMNLMVKFYVCYLDCKTKQRQPPYSWSPSTPDRAPIPHYPTGLSAVKKKNTVCNNRVHTSIPKPYQRKTKSRARVILSYTFTRIFLRLRQTLGLKKLRAQGRTMRLRNK